MYTHYLPIHRTEAGTIERIGRKAALGRRGIIGAPGAVAEARVVSVEDDPIAGWGDAKAIGRVERLIDGAADEPFVLAFLYVAA